MSFFGKFKPGSATASAGTVTSTKKDASAAKPTLLEKHLAEHIEPIRSDGSDKFFGLENYGSTCYANSVIQCLYYSEPFREQVLSFPSAAIIEESKRIAASTAEQEKGGLVHNGGSSLSTRPSAQSTPTPYPNPTSPARKQGTASTPTSPQKADENKDSPEYKKKMAIQAGPVLDMTQDKSHEYGMDESLFTSLKDIFTAIIANQSRVGVVSPHKFLEILRKENEMFRSAMHQDAHEFLNLLLNSVVEKVDYFMKQQAKDEAIVDGEIEANGHLRHKHNPGSSDQLTTDARWVQNIFEGVLTSETRCLTCETVSQRDEAFLDLSVDLSPHTSVTSCLRKFSQEEMLCERNKFHCDHCGGLQEAEKRMKIKRLPHVLALHLKRFKYTEDLQRLQKLFHKVVYPFHLRLFNTTDDAEDADRLYELYAVVVHIGGGPYHGHYVSIVKTRDRGWLLFDDELVEPVDKDYVLNFFGGEPVPGTQDARQLACAYVLFYQQTTLDAVVKEQEVEHQAQQPAATAAESEMSAEAVSSPKSDAFRLLGLNTSNNEHAEANIAASLPPLQPITTASHPSNLESNKSKKELKAEEKERKAVQKAEEKLEVQRQREAAEKRVEVQRRQNEVLKEAQEAGKQGLASETKKRSEDAFHHEKSAFSRFMRPGSMNLKSKPKMFAAAGHDERDDRNGETSPPPPPLPVALPHAAVLDERQMTAMPSNTSRTHAAEEVVKDHKEKKNRFSLGRKRSTQLF